MWYIYIYIIIHLHIFNTYTVSYTYIYTYTYISIYNSCVYTPSLRSVSTTVFSGGSRHPCLDFPFHIHASWGHRFLSLLIKLHNPPSYIQLCYHHSTPQSFHPAKKKCLNSTRDWQKSAMDLPRLLGLRVVLPSGRCEDVTLEGGSRISDSDSGILRLGPCANRM